jgi:hypothetical protein
MESAYGFPAGGIRSEMLIYRLIQSMYLRRGADEDAETLRRGRRAGDPMGLRRRKRMSDRLRGRGQAMTYEVNGLRSWPKRNAFYEKKIIFGKLEISIIP